METEVPEHFMYPKSTLEEADSVAYVLGNPNGTLTQYPFKFFDLDPTEVRVRILYTGLCQSDVLHGR